MEHILQRGETMEMLSARYGVPVCMLMKANGGGRPRAGMRMKIPSRQFCQEQKKYTVQEGDTLYAVAQKHGTTMYDLCRKNPGVFSGKLSEGMELFLPKPMQIYTCGPLDTVASVCEKFGITEADLRLWNLLEKNLYQGLQLKIPVSKL